MQTLSTNPSFYAALFISPPAVLIGNLGLVWPLIPLTPIYSAVLHVPLKLWAGEWWMWRGKLSRRSAALHLSGCSSPSAMAACTHTANLLPPSSKRIPLIQLKMIHIALLIMETITKQRNCNIIINSGSNSRNQTPDGSHTYLGDGAIRYKSHL